MFEFRGPRGIHEANCKGTNELNARALEEDKERYKRERKERDDAKKRERVRGKLPCKNAPGCTELMNEEWLKKHEKTCRGTDEKNRKHREEWGAKAAKAKKEIEKKKRQGPQVELTCKNAPECTRTFREDFRRKRHEKAREGSDELNKQHVLKLQVLASNKRKAKLRGESMESMERE